MTTGEAVVALGARPERGEGIVAGDVVNTAARLQAAAPIGARDSSTQSTMRSTERAIAFEPLEPVASEGQGRIRFRSGGRRQARSRFGVDTEAREPRRSFVGRELRARRCSSRRSSRAEREPSTQLVTVVGEPGVGKSRLVTGASRQELDRPAGSRHAGATDAACRTATGITFWALGEIVKAEAGDPRVR